MDKKAMLLRIVLSLKKMYGDVVINHFQTKVQIEWNLEDENNSMIIQQNVAKLGQPQNYKDKKHLTERCMGYRTLSLILQYLKPSNNPILFWK